MRDELASVCASIVVVICAIGLFNRGFRENWAQHLGMLVILASCAMIAWHSITTTSHVSSRVALLLVGLAVYGCGTAYKAWTFNRGNRRDASKGLA
jgi:drug/metabolite transporter (DMT)-like permease